MTHKNPFTQATLMELKQRHGEACKLQQSIDHAAIEQALRNWLGALNTNVIPIKFLSAWNEVAGATWPARDAGAASAAGAAWPAWAASAASAARAAWDARDARAAWDAGAAWPAWAASAASAARAAWDARDARAAWDARAAMDLSYYSITAIGAFAQQNEKLYATWVSLLQAFESGAWLMWITPDFIAVATLPIIHLSDNQLHCTDGPAFSWGKDVRDYYWHGVNVPKQIIMQPETITVQQIESEPNTEVRRVMLERYGQERYLMDSGAQEVARDNYGTLYRKDIPNDEPLVMVKVKNSTPEPSGEYKDYWLRVPPTIQTAHEAVAWTFSMSSKDYHPKFES